MSFPFVRQYDAMDCGPACLSMIAAWYGKKISLEYIRKKAYLTREGVSFLGLKEAAGSISMKATGIKTTFDRLKENAPLPCIVHWKQNHFIVVYRIRKGKVWIADPAAGLMKLSEKDFINGWSYTANGSDAYGLALLLEPDETFSLLTEEPPAQSTFSFFRSYLKPFRKTLVILLLGLLAGSIIQLIFPFMTQAIIDRGIKNKDIHFIYLILFGQLALIAGRLVIDFSRGWLLLNLGTKVNINIVSGFLEKLMKLPIAYFDTKLNGDILQRINDNARIENYLTSSSLVLLFSLFNILVFAVALAFYSLPVLFLFLTGSLVYTFYLLVFMPARGKLDNVRFQQMSSINGKMVNIVNGMQEMKIAGNEASNRAEWEKLQMELYSTRSKSLKLSQYQSVGGTMIHETFNMIITIVSATSVIKGSMTMGMMLAVQFIIGQLNSPLAQLVNFLRSTQDARISLERLTEIHRMDDEDKGDETRIQKMPDDHSIAVNNLSFQYEGPGSPLVLNNVSFTAPKGKVTAIVGESGSGKTTLLKLLMGFYMPVKGNILIGGTPLNQISINLLRKETGVVMQDGYVFPDTIQGNIAPGTDTPEINRLKYSIKVSNLEQLIRSLPLGINTVIGPGGHGLSQGQKQRILIARAVYKNPSILILDEATSSLDASNEKVIVENLSDFFRERTVIIVAHRLSTVKNADNIIVLSEGEISESGTHYQLIAEKNSYFRLVQNQLELEN